MTFEQMQKEAASRTWSEVEAIEKEVVRQYTLAIKEIEGLLKDQYAKLAGVKPGDYYNEVLKYNRLNTLLAEVKTAYTAAVKKAGQLTGQASELAMVNEYYRKMYVASWLDAFPEISVGSLPQPLIDITVYSSDAAWGAIRQKQADKIVDTFGDLAQYYPQSGTLSLILYKNLNADLQKIADQITKGLAAGQSYTKMIDGIKDIIGRVVKNGDNVSLTGAIANALRIVRTEGNRTLNAGAHAADMELMNNYDGDVKKEWLATLDDRTRADHAAVDGERVAPDATFSNGLMYPSEINCRCTTITIIDGVGPSLRRGRDPVYWDADGNPLSKEAGGKQYNKVMDFKSFDAWAAENNLKKNKFGQLYKKE